MTESAPPPVPEPATAAQPTAGQPAASAAMAPAGRPRRVWDLVLTIILLVVYVTGTLVVGFSSFLLAFASDSCGASSVCNYDQMGTGMTIAFVGVWVPVLFVVIGSIVLLVTRRIAFWVPIVGGVLTIIIAAVGWGMTVTAVQPG